MAVMATWKHGIANIPGEPMVLPEKIAWTPKVDMQAVLDLKKVVKNAGGKPDPYQVDLMRYYQYRHSNDILSHPLENSYQTKVLENFTWSDWVDSQKAVPKAHKRGDIRLKNYPYRTMPIAGPNG